MNVIYDIGRTLSDGTWALIVLPLGGYLAFKRLVRNASL